MKSEHLFKKASSRNKRSFLPFIFGFLFIFLFLFSIYYFWRESKVEINLLIGQNVEQLKDIFERIDSQVQILAFNQDKFYIDFLSVKNFSGSYVGPMLLTHPEKWAGPYLNDNLHLEGKLYQIIKVGENYYIVPGNGVVLSDGKIIGKDIKFESEQEINRMLQDKILINAQNKPLVAKVNISKDNLHEQIIHLVKVFEQIDKDCKIVSFEHLKNSINFLNVQNFAGSEIGSMNLTYPKHWKGPYMNENPTFQCNFYQILKTANNDYYIVPGDGVELPNGKTIGKDIVFDENSNIEKMMDDPQQLFLGNKPAAAKLKLTGRKVVINDTEETVED